MNFYGKELHYLAPRFSVIARITCDSYSRNIEVFEYISHGFLLFFCPLEVNVSVRISILCVRISKLSVRIFEVSEYPNCLVGYRNYVWISKLLDIQII